MLAAGGFQRTLCMKNVLATSASAARAPLAGIEVHGHRGCRGLRPENTLPAFAHALALGADALELDVVISADEQVVVAHEPWLASHLGPGPDGQLLAAGQGHAHRFYALPYARIRACPVGQWPTPGFAEQQAVPTYRPLLREVFELGESAGAAGRAPVGYSVEVKCTPAGDGWYHPRPARFVELVLAELRAAQVMARTTLLCFDARVLREARRLCPALRLCLLVETEATASLEEHIRDLGFVPDVLGPAFGLLSAARVRALRVRFPAMQLVPWTVNEASDLQRVLSWPVAGITTDYPDRLLTLQSRL